MKKILSLIAAVLLALTAFASCSKKNDKLVVAVPNDATNEARALLLLEKQGYKPEDNAGGKLAGLSLTIKDYKKLAEELGIGEITLRDIV